MNAIFGTLVKFFNRSNQSLERLVAGRLAAMNQCRRLLTETRLCLKRLKPISKSRPCSHALCFHSSHHDLLAREWEVLSEKLDPYDPELGRACFQQSLVWSDSEGPHEDTESINLIIAKLQYYELDRTPALLA